MASFDYWANGICCYCLYLRLFISSVRQVYMKYDRAVVWRIISASVALLVSLLFGYWAILQPDYAAALIFVSIIIQLVIYMAYKNKYP